LRAETNADLVIEVAKLASERVHEIIKMHAGTLPTVAAAVAFGLLVARQIYAETVTFAVNSMDGDPEYEASIRVGAIDLFRVTIDEQNAEFAEAAR